MTVGHALVVIVATILAPTAVHGALALRGTCDHANATTRRRLGTAAAAVALWTQSPIAWGVACALLGVELHQAILRWMERQAHQAQYRLASVLLIDRPHQWVSLTELVSGRGSFQRWMMGMELAKLMRLGAVQSSCPIRTLIDYHHARYRIAPTLLATHEEGAACSPPS